MFFYDNQLELDEINQLPMNHVTTIRLDSDHHSAWAGCQDGEIYKIDLKTAEASLRFSNDRIVTDLASTDAYLFCLSKNSVQLFNVQQQATDLSLNFQTSDFTDEFFNRDRSVSSANPLNNRDAHLVKFDARASLNALCQLNEKHQYLIGGFQDELYLFDVNYLNVIKKFPLHDTPSSCIKIKRIASRHMFVTASVSGRITVYDEFTIRPILSYKPFKMSLFDFDLINDDFIMATGFDNR